jgi:PAS domain S-box-containing protein
MFSSSAQFAVDKPARWYAEILDNLLVGIYRSTLEGKFVFCNRAMAEIFGYESRKELMASPVINLYWEKRDRGNLIRGIMEKGQIQEICIPMKKKDGSPIWCAVTARPVFDDDGMMVFLDGLMRNITHELEEKEAALHLDEILNTINDFIFILDLQGNIIDINRVGAQSLGYDKKELINKPLKSFLLPEYQDLFPHFLSDVAKIGREESIITMVDKSGDDHYLEFHAFLAKKGGKPDHIKGLARDETERIKSQSLELTREKFQGVLEMAGGVAHRLNQPLTIINNLISEILLDLKPEDIHHEKIAKVRSQIEKLNEIAQKIRGITKYEAMDYVSGVKIVDLDKST